MTDAPSHHEGENRAKKRRTTRPVDHQPASLLSRGWRWGGREAASGGVRGAEGSFCCFGNVRAAPYRTRHRRRNGMCPTWPKLYSLSVKPAERGWLRAETRKCSLQGEYRHENRGIPREKCEPRAPPKVSSFLTWEFISKRKIHPQRHVEMGPSSWDTSVFVPKSPRMVVPICSQETSLEGSRLDSQRIRGSSWMSLSCFAKLFD